MNYNNLRAEIARNGLTVSKLANDIEISKKTLYSRLKEETAFKQPEIERIASRLSLGNEQIMDIFFGAKVN